MTEDARQLSARTRPITIRPLWGKKKKNVQLNWALVASPHHLDTPSECTLHFPLLQPIHY
jgi:hypothetical protein